MNRQKFPAAVAALLILASSPASAQTVPTAVADGGHARARLATAIAVEVPPVIDGRLDEAVWASAPVIRDFTQHEPHEGEPATERTEVRILYDDNALYIGAWLFDSNSAGIVAGEHRRDANLRDSDAFMVVLDTYLDRQNGFVFGTTPAGIEYDGQVAQEGASRALGSQRQQGGSVGGFNINWDGSWDVATSRDLEGWYAEIRIPFSTLRFASGREQSWGINFARHIRRKNEQAFWSPVPRQFDFYRLTMAGVLEGLEVPGHRPVSLTPYVLGSATRDYVVGTPTSWPSEVGADLKVGVTPSLMLDLTWNTDFAHVEVDEQQVNLTRFGLFFPEKRPFFLENAGLFSVGAPRSVEMFFSRRIGIGAGQAPVPIVGGGRLTGRAAGFNVGFLQIHTDEVDQVAQPTNAYGVARIARELPNRSQVGAIAVNRSGGGGSDDYNRTFAIDGRWGIGDAITLDGFVAATQTPGFEGREHAYSVRGGYSSRDWRANIYHTLVGEDFNPEVGFLERSGYRMYEVFLQRNLRPTSIPWIREYTPHFTWRTHVDFAGVQESGYLHLDPATLEFSNGGRLSSYVNITRERLREPFPISTGIVIPVGVYDNVEVSGRGSTNPSAPVSVSAGYTIGGFLSGSQVDGSTTITMRRDRTIGAFSVGHTRVELEEGDFDVTLARLRLAYSFRPNVFVQSLIQYSDQSDSWSGNLRFGWLNTAGTGLFLVYNEDQGLGPISGPLNRTFVVKYTRQFDLSGF